ncbi:VanZ family protein [Enterococcus mediterraneensis]|uniref:VanZ family protein n=1 Tax=Enterococcus mediterraneensis TaxID=2364791 RepID=UPI000F048B30|nr:VanZ family protein [Enterococcus mediterraneensis]
MSAYIIPIKTALLIFPFLALFLSGFFLIYEYRKYGTFVFTRAIILYSFIFYLLCAYFLVVLPLPPISEVAHYTSPTIELHLGASLQHFLQQTVLNIKDPSTYLPAMKQNVFLEPMFNILLVVPFGVYLRYYFKVSFIKTILWSFLLSLSFETLQYTGLLFIYPRPYRLADVNDLLNNTLGGMLGFAIEPLLTFVLPTRKEIDEEAYARGQEVTFFRRLAAFVIDWIVLYLVAFAATIVYRLITKDYQANFVDNIWWFFGGVFLYFVCFAYLFNGQTLGKKAVRIRVVEEQREKIRFSALLKRYGILYFFYGGIGQLTALLAPLVQSRNHFIVAISVFLSLCGGVLQVVFFLTIGWSFFKKRRQLFYEKQSHTYTISTIPIKEK